MHLAIAIWTYGEPLIFPGDNNDITVDVASTTSGNISTVVLNETSFFWPRLIKTPWLSLLLLLIIVLFFFNNLIVAPIVALLRKFCCK